MLIITGGFFSWSVGENDRNSTQHVIQIDQVRNTSAVYFNQQTGAVHLICCSKYCYLHFCCAFPHFSPNFDAKQEKNGMKKKKKWNGLADAKSTTSYFLGPTFPGSYKIDSTEGS